MALDIRGGRKNTAIKYSDYVVFEELLSNAIDSYLIRKSREPAAPPFLLSLSVTLVPRDLIGSRFDVEIKSVDNGCGFGSAEVKAFVTKDSTYKDQLQISGIGKCKGAGRIQFFHHFESLSINSVFEEGGKKYRRFLDVDGRTGEVSEDSFGVSLVEDSPIETVFLLKDWRNPRDAIKQKSVAENIIDVFSSERVVRHLYTSFLQRLIILKRIIGEFRIEVVSMRGGDRTIEVIESGDLPLPNGDVTVIPLRCAHEKDLKYGPDLRVTRYTFPAEESLYREHEVALCANSAIVQDVTKKYLRNTKERCQPSSGGYELLLVESDFLEDLVNQQRDGFDIEHACSESGSLIAGFSMEDVLESLEDYVFKVITPPDFDKYSLIASTENRFGITRQMIDGASVKIHYGDDEESIAKRVLRKLQEDIVADTSKLFSIKNELLTLDPRAPDFRRKVGELSWKYASSIKKMDMTNLSQLVVRRAAMIEVLALAVKGLLDCQVPVDGVRNEHEKIIHNIFFPMGKDSDEVMDHDIWLLNEEYQYYDYIASDKQLGSIKFDGDDLFDSDIDESLAKLFAENNRDHKKKRPDIALFTKEGAAIIIEFKSPDVEIQDHIPDLGQYARLLAAKSGGRLKRFYGYLIGCRINKSRVMPGFTRFADGRGYFNSAKLNDDETGRHYGELYSELLLYDDFIGRAELRLRIYKDKLKVDLS